LPAKTCIYTEFIPLRERTLSAGSLAFSKSAIW